jgi:predicted molibdopterin-dependent oxidoreductase YjgC
MTGAGQLQRVAETERPRVAITIDGVVADALEGDTVLTALLVNGRRLRDSDFGDGPRAGFCLMGACQDCWVALADGRRLRACTTLAEDGMALEPIP